MFIKNIISIEAASVLELTKTAKLIDVRSRSEWKNHGIPSCTNQEILLLPWRVCPLMEINNSFGEIINLEIQNKETILFFICKSGVRSLEAAKLASQMGYLYCYNIIDGTEGNFSGEGWKHNNLPWQSF